MQQVSGAEGAVGDVVVGSILGGRYRLEERVGAGGMATIYRSRDTTLQRDVAVKVLHPHLADDPSVLGRFRTEARHAASLVHPHIVHVYDQGDEVRPYIVMEHVDGPSLRDVIRARGRLTPPEALALIEAVSRALTRAHAAGVVHRDIKPENVLVTSDGVAKVADFGIARALAETNHTQSGALVGSVHYLAPELVDGQPAGPASDQYATGVLLFELLTGRKALVAETPMAVALRHLREPIPAPSEHVSDVSPDLDAVVAKATAMDPEDRYPDMEAFIAALAEAVPGGPEPVVVSRGTGDGESHTLVIPPPGEDDESPTFPAVGTASLHRTPTTRPPLAEEGDDEDDAPTRSRGRRWLVGGGVLLVLLLLLGGAAYATYEYVIAPVQTVPAIDGMSVEEAEAELAGRGIELLVSETRQDRSTDAGTILEQDPGAGAELRRGGSVTVAVSSGPAEVAMPDVILMELGAARALLEAEPYHFEIERVDEEHHDTVPAGQVIGQHPAAESDLRQNAAVILNVSLGIEQVEVPDVAGSPREVAEDAIAEARLTLGGVAEEWSDQVPTVGAVIRQDLEAGTQVDKGSEMRIVVSRGALTVEVPNLMGRPIDDAVAEVRALGLEPRIFTQPIPRIGPFRRGEVGFVEAQSPQGGAAGGIQRGQAIDLYTFAEEEGDEDSDD